MNPPPQLSEPTFRWCEPFITRAVSRWPDETSFSPEEMTDLSGRRLSPNTFAARMRDSIVSLKRFSWSPTTVDTTKLQTITGDFSISFGPDGKVWWKARGRRGRPSQLTQETRDKGFLIDADVSRIPWVSPTDDELRALALLLDKQRLVGPFTITGVVPEETAASLEAEFAVAVTRLPEKNHTIIT